MSLTCIAPNAEPRPAARDQRPGRLSVADALRSRFPLNDAGRGGKMSVAEALRSRFPHLPRTSAEARPAMTLPWRVRRTPLAVPAARAQPPASPELLRRVLDGLKRL